MSGSSAFVGSIPRTYHEYLGPLLFHDYARDLAGRLRLNPGARVLELACGTGIVTREIARALPEGARLTATDLNEAMLDVARETVGADERVAFRQADACKLPFADSAFDAIACQYGVMFFPNKAKAMREARRVLAPGGGYVFNVWDSLEHNPIPGLVHETLAGMFPGNPPAFLNAAPYGYFDRDGIEKTLRDAGFGEVHAEYVEFPSKAPSAADAARGFLEGTPLLLELRDRGVTDPAPVRAAVAAALAARFGDHPCQAAMRAIVFEAR